MDPLGSFDGNKVRSRSLKDKTTTEQAPDTSIQLTSSYEENTYPFVLATCLAVDESQILK